jgi:radical SAM protein with 4Fe4S-binding SPASM domain
MMSSVSNRDMNISEYTRRQGLLRSRPRAIFVELTQNCNLRCWMCRPDALPQDDRMMSEEIFGQVADELFPFAEIIDLRGWGESLLYPRFRSAVERASGSGAKVKLYTNLSVDDATLYETLIANSVRTTVSFDAASPDKFKRLRRGSDFDLILRNLKQLSTGFQKKNQQALLELSVTVQGDNLAELDGIVLLAGQLGIPRVRLFPVICSKLSRAHLSHYEDVLVGVLDRVAITGRHNGVAVQLGAALTDASAIPSAVLSETCIHPWTHCYVSWDGGVGFCDHLIGNQRYILGSVKTGIITAWNNSDFVQLRAEHATSQPSNKYAACKWCYGRRYSDTEHELMPSALSRVVCSSRGDQLHGPGYTAESCEFVAGTDSPFPRLLDA